MKPESETDPLDKLPPALQKDLDKNLCTCMDIPKTSIINAILNVATTLEEVKKQTCANMGAGCCSREMERLIECLFAPEPRRRKRHSHKVKTKNRGASAL